MKNLPSIELSLIFPCYKIGNYGERNLDRVYARFQELRGGVECVAVDDGSPDETGVYLKGLAKTRPWLRVVRLSKNQGKGGAVLQGLKESRGRFAVMNDIDLQYDPDDMWLCYQKLASGEADLAIGSRLHPRSLYHIRSRDIRYIFTRHIFSRVLNWFIRSLILPGIFDTQCGLKGFTRAFIETLTAAQPMIRGFAFDIEVLVIARLYGFRVQEIPVQFYYTDIESTVKFVKQGRLMLLDILQVYWNVQRHYYRPLR